MQCFSVEDLDNQLKFCSGQTPPTEELQTKLAELQNDRSKSVKLIASRSIRNYAMTGTIWCIDNQNHQVMSCN